MPIPVGTQKRIPARGKLRSSLHPRIDKTMLGSLTVVHVPASDFLVHYWTGILDRILIRGEPISPVYAATPKAHATLTKNNVSPKRKREALEDIDKRITI